MLHSYTIHAPIAHLAHTHSYTHAPTVIGVECAPTLRLLIWFWYWEWVWEWDWVWWYICDWISVCVSSCPTRIPCPTSWQPTYDVPHMRVLWCCQWYCTMRVWCYWVFWILCCLSCTPMRLPCLHIFRMSRWPRWWIIRIWVISCSIWVIVVSICCYYYSYSYGYDWVYYYHIYLYVYVYVIVIVCVVPFCWYTF